MDSKIIKVIDDHNVDRTAVKVCAIKFSGIDYVIYSIERDSENDNVFVSKLINNISGTSGMMNIEDSMEKEIISSIVKEMIKFALNNEKTDSKIISLSEGRTVEIIPVVIDKKEQEINIQYTYITTVSKNVVKDSSDFFDRVIEEETREDVQLEEHLPIFDSLIENNVVSKNEVSLPSSEDKIVPFEVSIAETAEDIKVDNFPKVDMSLENSVNLPFETSNNLVSPVDSQSDEISTVPVPSFAEPIPFIRDKIEESVIDKAVPIMSGDSTISSISEAPKNLDSRDSQSDEISTVPVPFFAEESVIESNDNSAPVETIEPKKPIILDGSNESNLNAALGEIGTERVVSTDNVDLIRNFGVDEEVKDGNDKVVPLYSENNMPVYESTKTLTRKAGFANNKFFVVMAIALFLVACGFLGYEAFNYFQLTK